MQCYINLTENDYILTGIVSIIAARYRFWSVIRDVSHSQRVYTQLSKALTGSSGS